MSQLKDFLILKKIGDGAFSSVHKVKRCSDEAVYALKKVKMGKLTEKEKQNALNEIRILASINHPNVIGYKDAFFDNNENCLCIIMELADGGDLLQAIEQHKKQKSKFTEKQIWHFFIQTVRGLKALHDLKIVHRDIKCANLFMTKEGVIKLGDLNVSKVAKRGLLQTQTGTPYYASPEVWKEQPYDHKSDIWSLGCVLYEMITLLPPFRAQSMQGLAGKVMSGRYDKIPQHFSNDLSQMVKSCLQVSPNLRPTCDRILATPGLLNHITGTLEDLDIDPEDREGQDNLLKTIKCPRHMGMISDRLPAPQYRQKIKRCNSMAIESSNQSKLEIEGDVTKSSMNQLNGKKDNLSQMAPDRKSGGSRVLCNLPTIVEDQIDDDTHDVLSALERQVSKVNEVVGGGKQKNLVHLKSKIQIQPYIDNSRQQNFEQQGGDNTLRKEEPAISQRQLRPPLAGGNPRSADYYIQKGKAQLLNPVPTYKPTVGLPPTSQSDNDDVSTRVSSKSHIQRSYNYQQKKQSMNLDYYMPTHDSQTPAHMSNKLDSVVVSRVPESHYYNPRSNYSQAQQLPQLSKPSASNLDNHYLAPSSQESYSARGNSRYQSGNNRNESLGVSRALGIGSNRYDGVGSAIRLARAASIESVPKGYLQQQQVYQPRGPCPSNFKSRMAVKNSNHLLSEPGVGGGLHKYQSEVRGLPDIYSSRQHVQQQYAAAGPAGQSADSGERRHYHYAPVVNQGVPNSRFRKY